MRTLDPPRFYCGRRRFHAFELLLSCDLNWFPVSPSAFLFFHICGRANSTWTYYSNDCKFKFWLKKAHTILSHGLSWDELGKLILNKIDSVSY